MKAVQIQHPGNEMSSRKLGQSLAKSQMIVCANSEATEH
jgi:hypothetical protein